MRLSSRDVMVAIIGAIVGLLLGMAMVSADEDLALFGTAGGSDDNEVTSATSESIFYIVNIADAQTWLAEEYPNLETEQTEALDGAFNSITALPSATDFLAESDNTWEVAEQTVMPQTYAALAGVEQDNIGSIQPEDVPDGVNLCLGLFDDPFEADMFIYLKVTQDEADKLNIPKDWEQLDKPAETDILWYWLGCFPNNNLVQ